VASDDRAILVGISHYPALGNLAGPENDAQAFAEWLMSPSGGKVPEDNIDLILSSKFRCCEDARCKDAVSATPTADAVKKAIDKVESIGDTGPGYVGRRLYLFMAGHGLARDFKDTALLMANATEKRTGHHVPGPPYANWFRESAYFDEVVLIMDCCPEDYKLSPLQLIHLDPVTDSGAPRPPVRHYYALAARRGQPAREQPDENGKMHGVLTTAILAGLLQGPRGGGDVTGDWLSRFVRGEMPQQHPEFDYDPAADIVLVEGAAASFRVRIHVGLGRQIHGVEVHDGMLNLVLPSARSAGTWEWSLSPGLYTYGHAGGVRNFLELKGEGREIDVSL
jgi:hypothetical protein